MLGAGIFINTVELAKRAGLLGAFSYSIVGLLMLPLILCMAQLVSMHPSGGFYTYGRAEISPLAGFLSAWSYFTGKLASAMLIIHTAMRLICQVIPLFGGINIYLLDCSVLALFIGLNMLNVQTGSSIQTFFISFKLIPIIFAILSGLWLFSGHPFAPVDFIFAGVPSTIPLVIYAMIGFEAACSLSSRIENADKNAPRAIFFSYAIVIALTTCYQLFFYLALPDVLGGLANYLNVFPALTSTLFGHNDLQLILTSFMHLAIAASALGGSYGILFSNAWNLYTLAQHKHTLMPDLLTSFNRHHIPWLCVVFEGVVALIYLAVTKADQITLQQISALASVTAYSISVAALLYAKRRDPALPIAWWIPLFGAGNCLLFLSNGIYNLCVNGLNGLILYSLLLAIGVAIFLYTRKNSLNATSN